MSESPCHCLLAYYIVNFVLTLLSGDVVSHAYSMASGVEGMILDATKYRNLGGFINHADKPNVEATCIFDFGVEQTIIIALQDIPRGHQILLDYSKHYFGEEEKLQFVDLTTLSGFPLFFPSEIFSKE